MTDDEASDAPLGDVADEIRSRRDAADEETGDPAEDVDADAAGGVDRPDDAEPDPPELDLGLDGPESDRVADGPLGDITERVRARRDRDAAEDDSPFETMDVGELDGEEVWSELFEEGETEREKRIGIGAQVERVEGGRDYEDFVVEKAKFCKQCPHLGEPPLLSCSREGTEIIEVVDSERFRVRDCPMVRHADENLSEL